MSEEPKPTFFQNPETFRKWLDKHHQQEEVLWVGYYKKHTKKASITWPESVEQAICYGWIDGLRKSIDDEAYKIRFTPRKPDSHWSDVNIKMIKRLRKEGKVTEAGEEAYSRRDEKNSRRASYEQKNVKLDPEFEKTFKEHGAAWKNFKNLPHSTRKPSIWWVMSAKRSDTRERRMKILIESSEKNEVIPPLKWGQKKK